MGDDEVEREFKAAISRAIAREDNDAARELSAGLTEYRKQYKLIDEWKRDNERFQRRRY